MAALDAAMSMLAVRALTESEVRTRLAARGYLREPINSAVAALLARSYLDDPALAYNVAVFRAKRLYGPSRVTGELRRRGLVQNLVAGTVARVFAELDEDALALAAAVKLLGRLRRPGRGGARHTVAAALARRGFSRGAVAKAMRTAGSASHQPQDEPPAAWDEEIDEPDFETDP